MNYPAHILPLILACAALLSPPALAQTQNGTTGLTVGQRVALPKPPKSANSPKSQTQTQTQTQAFNTLPQLQIDGKIYLVAEHRRTPDGTPLTLVIGPDGVVGQSFHEVVISGQPADTLQQKAAAALAQADAVKTYEHMNMTVARYATLAQAVAAMQAIRIALPGADVGLPISFDLARPQ